MTFFGPDLRNGLPIGLGSVAGFGIAPRFSPASLFTGGVQGAWYDPSDSTTLFSDRAGTTPCGTPGGGSVVPVGLMLDKSQGLVLGSELVTAPYSGAVSGGFSITSTSVVRDGVTAGGTASLTLSTTLTANAFYQVTFTAAGLSGDNTIIRVGSTASGNFYRITTAGTYTIYLPAGGTAAILGIAPFTGSAGGITLTNISVRALAGNHAIAANDTTARPELRARVNLLTYSEQFDNAAWGKSATSVAANTTATTDPLGGNTADTLTATAATNFHDVEQASITPPNTGTTYTVSFYIKKNTARYVSVGWWRSSTQAAGAGFDLDTGTITGTGDIGAGYSASGSAIQSVGNGWYRCSVVVTGSVSQQFPAVFIRSTAYAGGASTWFGETFTAAGTESVYLWGAQLTATNEFPANTYQRIVDANTYDAVGFPRYFAANGTSSAMSTPGNVNLSGTDKVTVFAGVRKLSAAVRGMLVELSATAANQGAFNVCAPEAADDYSFTLTGNAGSPYYQPAGYAAPISNVVSCGYDFAGALRANEIVPRINGVLAQSGGAGTSAGTNTAFLNAPLNIGARNNGASIFFNGNIYSLIVVGSAVSAGQISATEQWVAGKVGITI